MYTPYATWLVENDKFDEAQEGWLVGGGVCVALVMVSCCLDTTCSIKQGGATK